MNSGLQLSLWDGTREPAGAGDETKHGLSLPPLSVTFNQRPGDGELERWYPWGRHGVPRGTLVLSPHRTLAALPPPQAAPQRGVEQQGHRQSPTLPGSGGEGGGAGGPRSYPPGEPCPLLARLASTSWQDVRTVREQFLTSGRTLALKGKEHRTLGAVVRAPLRDGVSTHLGGAGQGLCPRPPHLGSQPRESGPPGSGALIPP